MKSDSPPDAPDEVDGEVVSARRGVISWTWLFPMLALAVTGWLFWNNWKSKGPEITISFTSAPGIQPGKTNLIYRGINAGTVSNVALDPELENVIVSVRLNSFAAELARDGTDFWIEQPVISVREISGLESIIEGNSIHARPHGGETVTLDFQGLSEAPLSPLDAENLNITLKAVAVPAVGRGTPIYHRGVRVGEVRNEAFNADGQPDIQATIYQKFSSRITSNSRFWPVSATALSASPGAVRLDIPSLEGLLDGSIAVDYFGPPGDAIASGMQFDLSPNEIAARAEGPPLTITFENGAGLRAGETRVTSRGQAIGLIEEVTTDPVKGLVTVTARLESAFAPLASKDSVFTIVRPNISKEGIHGLGTLITGPSIDFQPGSGSTPGNKFVGTETPQFEWNPAPEDKDGMRVVLWADKLPQLHAGAPVYHNGMIAGRVIEQRLGLEGRPELLITIDGGFRDFLRVNTRFWRVPAAVLSVGPGVIGVEVPGLSALWQGGVAFDSIGEPGPAAPESPTFALHPSEQAASAISEPIRITFENGQGLLAGKTELRYLGAPAGIVEEVVTTEGRVVATARFRPGYEFLRSAGSEFAIVGTEIDLKGVKGLETLIGGVYINCAPGGGSEYADNFHAVPPEEPELLNEPGFEIVIVSSSTKIDAGAPVSYNNTPVGEVIKKTLSQDGKQIILTARIRDEHRNLVRTNSFFWDATTVEAKIGFLKLQINSPTLVDPEGRIAFRTPDTGGTLAKERTVYQLASGEPKMRDERAVQETPAPVPTRLWRK